MSRCYKDYGKQLITLHTDIKYISYTYRQCVCYKDHIKEHHDHLLQEKSTTDYRVNVTNTNYFLLGIKDDTIAFVDATTEL